MSLKTKLPPKKISDYGKNLEARGAAMADVAKKWIALEKVASKMHKGDKPPLSVHKKLKVAFGRKNRHTLQEFLGDVFEAALDPMFTQFSDYTGLSSAADCVSDLAELGLDQAQIVDRVLRTLPCEGMLIEFIDCLKEMLCNEEDGEGSDSSSGYSDDGGKKSKSGDQSEPDPTEAPGKFLEMLLPTAFKKVMEELEPGAPIVIANKRKADDDGENPSKRVKKNDDSSESSSTQEDVESEHDSSK